MKATLTVHMQQRYLHKYQHHYSHSFAAAAVAAGTSCRLVAGILPAEDIPAAGILAVGSLGVDTPAVDIAVAADCTQPGTVLLGARSCLQVVRPQTCRGPGFRGLVRRSHWLGRGLGEGVGGGRRWPCSLAEGLRVRTAVRSVSEMSRGACLNVVVD
jgi:hypothetical protein